MKIFKEELAIAEQIRENTSVSCLAKVEAVTEQEKETIKASFDNRVAKAKINDSDLFYHKAILVSTTWNKNDDIFSPEEVWAARDTPMHKPTNLNHESSKIVGHMTNNWAIDEDGNIIDDSTAIDDLPSKFHILTGAVIYQIYHNDEKYQGEVEELVQEILRGEQFVSMECCLNGFDYAIREKDGGISVVERNQDTAFLTKHLRAYGGKGEFEGMALGRVLRNINFIGKAYTKIPANPESVIFTKEKMLDFSEAKIKKIDDLKSSGVHSNSISNLNGDEIMSKEYTDKISELEAALSKAQDEKEALATKLAAADTQKYIDQIETLEAKATEADEALAAKLEEINNLNETLKTSAAKIDELTEAKAELEGVVAKVEQEKLVAQRVSLLVDGGFSKEDATAKVSVFENLNDDQFKTLAEELIEAKKMGKKDKKEMKEDESCSSDEDSKGEEAVDNTDLDTSEASDSTEESLNDAPQGRYDTVQAEVLSFLKPKIKGDK